MMEESVLSLLEKAILLLQSGEEAKEIVLDTMNLTGYVPRVAFQPMIRIPNIPMADFSKVPDLVNPTLLVAHHSGGNQAETVISIDEYHRSKGWSGVGYHFVVHADGSIWQGRPLSKQGAHALNYNSRSIGFCVVGNSDLYYPSPLQQFATFVLVQWLIQKVGVSLLYHRDTANVTCPGRRFMFGLQRQLCLPF